MILSGLVTSNKPEKKQSISSLFCVAHNFLDLNTEVLFSILLEPSDYQKHKFILREKSFSLSGETLIVFCRALSNIDKPQSVHFELIKKAKHLSFILSYGDLFANY